MSTLYFDCSSGISGDMTVAALLDLGADAHKLQTTLSSLPLDGYEIQISRVIKSGIDACDFLVKLNAEHENHDHDMNYLHGHEHEHQHEHCHEHEHEHQHEHCHEHKHEHQHEHCHEHEHQHHEETSAERMARLYAELHPGKAPKTAHSHDHDHHSHAPHRNLYDIEQILRAGTLTPHALELALKIFRIVAQAEAHVHGKSIEDVHFHEVGAVDSIIDIAAVAVCIDDLGIDQVIIPSLTEGTGQVRCQHGLLPIPVPATSAIVSAHHLPMHISSVMGELITPTGAAIAAALCTGYALPETFEISRIGIGAGKRDYKNAGILRAMLLETVDHSDSENTTEAKLASASMLEHDEVQLLQTNLDDCSGETLGFAMDLLLKAGALDAYYTPIYMKKNRPAYLLSVLCKPEDVPAMETIIFRHTTGIGIRRCAMQRTKLPRRIVTVETPLGNARAKLCTFENETFCYPEYEDAAALARSSGKSLEEIYSLIRQHQI